MSSIVYEGKQIKILHDGKVVVVSPVDNDKIIVPFFCPTCEYPMKTAGDAESYRECGSCYLCNLHWIKPKITIDKTSDHWQEYMHRRHVAFLPSINFG